MLHYCISFLFPDKLIQFSIQVRILKRGLELLEIGGKLVYSTCSLCPLEDESVIHHMLYLCKGND